MYAHHTDTGIKVWSEILGSIYLTLAIAVERYVTVCHPFFKVSYKYWITLRMRLQYSKCQKLIFSMCDWQMILAPSGAQERLIWVRPSVHPFVRFSRALNFDSLTALTLLAYSYSYSTLFHIYLNIFISFSPNIVVSLKILYTCYYQQTV